MMIHRNIIPVFYAFILALGCISCSDEPEPEPISEVQRAVLVYMVADNSLSGFDSSDINEMIIAANNGDFQGNRLFVYHSSRNETPKLKEITASGEQILKEYEHTPYSVSISRMSEVFSDFKSISPAKSYSLILWSHSSAWIQNGEIEPQVSTNSWGEERGHYMNIPSLAKAVTGQGFDYIYFDCCYMANVESLYELRYATPWVVASTIEVPADGMPYDETLKYLMADTPDLRAAAQTTFDYYDAMSGSNRTCTLSIIDMTKLSQLAQATRDIYQNGTPPSGYTPQTFMVRKSYLFDMKDYINSFDISESYLNQWNEVFDSTVTYSVATPMIWNQVSLDRANGLSTYILDADHKADYNGYNTLSWWHDVASFL